MAIAQMDLIKAGHAYHVCTAMPLCPNVLLVTEALGWQESQGSAMLVIRDSSDRSTAFTENLVGSKSPCIDGIDKHIHTLTLSQGN